MTENGEHLGISPPLATDPPKEIDLKLNELLLQELKTQNNFESAEETKKRFGCRVAADRMMG
jgi:poly(A) polymerase